VTKRRGVGAVLALAAAVAGAPAEAGAGGSAELIDWAQGRGVRVEAREGYARSRDPLAGVVAGSGGGPVAHGLKLHNCRAAFLADAPGYLPLSYSFIEAGPGDCAVFLVPEPAERPRARRASPELVALRLLDRMVALAAPPELELAPDEIGLTGMPTYLWLKDEPKPVSATAGVPGLTVEAEAAPREYVWTPGDGGQLITDHPGSPWSPTRPGSIAYTYERKGRYEVVVEVTYYARYRVNEGPWRPLGAFRTSDSRLLPVRELIPMLVERY
jgi:hypothetical protein